MKQSDKASPWAHVKGQCDRT